MSWLLNHWLPEQASTAAPVVDRGLVLLHTTMAVIFLAWTALFIGLLVRYRARPGVPAAQPAEGPSKLALLLVPLVLVFADEIFMIFGFAMPAWGRLMVQEPDPASANVIEVVAEQFAWNVHYPGPDGRFGRRSAAHAGPTNILGLDPEDPSGKDDIVTLNEFHFPLGRTTLLRMTSKDVIHSFYVPAFRLKRDVTPGLVTPIWFEPTKAGKYECACAQLCGNGHATMRADVIVETEAEFAAWLKSQAAGAPS